MKTGSIFVLMLFGIVLFIFMIGFSQPSSAQIFTYSPFFAPFNPFLYPGYAFPFIPPVPTYSAPVLNPVLSPYTVLPTLPFRSAAATIITLPTVAPTVTAYAPLGTLNLTPSTLIFLTLLLTLAE